ncbi:type III ribulose-bisphosphate carboxylase [Candidatus Woesearchaeota archaeon]|nr:type III ribulose-bisphosphate carboxylase [Candidatus Woesearchaeota archaeon]
MLLKYINKKYKPGSNDLVAEYRVEPNKISIEEACEKIAGESSIGTWTTISTMNKKIAKKLKPNVYSIDKKTKQVKIAYPAELFEAGNMPQIYSAIAGNIFGMKAVKGLRLEDISFPKSIMNKFSGPKFGVKGVRKLLGIKKRPLVGTIVKPKVGLTYKQHAKVAYDAWRGGLDIVKDDENLASMSFNNFEKRVKETLRLRDKAEKETGEKKMYMANVTAETDTMLKRAKYVKSLGGEYVMIDIITSGWSGLQTLREANLGRVIHAHRAMHGAFTENPKHGISMLTIAKTARLIGVDQIHVGAIVGKMKGGKEEVQAIGEEIEKNIIQPDKEEHVLAQRWWNIKPVFAVCSGGLWPGKIPNLMKAMGNDIIMQFGGGCHGHPDGTFAGARAIRQALDASMNLIPLKEYSEFHKELNLAIKKWKE